MITLQMASMPEREAMLRISLASLLPQVDKANIMLWRYQPGDIPDFLNHPKVRVFHHDNRLEDGSRFLFADHIDEGQVLICDDDIEYSPDFVAYLQKKLSWYGGIVGIMGKILKGRPIKSYYKDEIVHYKAFEALDHDVAVEVLGMCGVMYDASLKIGAEDIKCPNSDICISSLAKRRGWTLTVCAHDQYLLRNLMTMAPNAPSIFGKYSKNDKILTDFVNENL